MASKKTVKSKRFTVQGELSEEDLYTLKEKIEEMAHDMNEDNVDSLADAIMHVAADILVTYGNK